MADPTQSEEGGYTAPKIIASEIPISNIKDMKLGTVIIIANLTGVVQKTTAKPYLKLYETTATDKTGSVRVIWYNKGSLRYLKSSLQYVLLGKLEENRNTKTLVDPIITPLMEYKKWLKKLSKS